MRARAGRQGKAALLAPLPFFAVIPGLPLRRAAGTACPVACPPRAPGTGESRRKAAPYSVLHSSLFTPVTTEARTGEEAGSLLPSGNRGGVGEQRLGVFRLEP